MFKDRGLLFTTFVVDTLGDSDLDNDVFVDGSFSLLKDAGSHPGFYADFCEDIAIPLLGGREGGNLASAVSGYRRAARPAIRRQAAHGGASPVFGPTVPVMRSRYHGRQERVRRSCST